AFLEDIGIKKGDVVWILVVVLAIIQFQLQKW
ncbi:unnamed protein product, partial [marine sediment metagenome]